MPQTHDYSAKKCTSRFLPSKKGLNEPQPGSIKLCGSTTMNHRPSQTGILALSILLSLAGCGNERKTVATSTNAPAGTVDRLEKHARNVVTTTRDYFAQKRDRWEKSYSDRLSEFDKQLADMKRKTSQAGDRASSEWSKVLSQLELKKESAAHKLEQLKNAGAERWQEFKTNADTAFADLEKSARDTFSRFTDHERPARP
jgi:hypothetical protein